MAITENKFTSAELKAAVEANPDLLNEVVPVLTEREYTVQDKATHETFKTNFEANLMRDKTREWAEKLEADVLEMTGIPKIDANEKYYDYFKRATGQKLQSVTKLEKELGDLKSKSNPSEADKVRIKQLEDGIKEKEAEFSTKLAEKDQELKKYRTLAPIESAIAKLRASFKKDLPASVVELVVEKSKSDLEGSANFDEQGRLYFKGADGKPLVNPADMSYLGPEDVLKSQHLKDVIDTGQQQPGSGSQPPTGGAPAPKAGEKVPFTGFPTEVRTKTDASDYLIKLGIPHGTPEFDTAYKTAEALPLR